MANYRPRSLSDINNSYDNERRAEKAIKNKTEKIEPAVHKPASPFLTPPDSFIIPAEVEKEKEKVFSDISGDVDELIREFSKPEPKKKAVRTERPLHGVKPVEQTQYSSMRRREGAPKIVSTADPNRRTRQTVASLAQKAARKDEKKDASSYYRQPRPEKEPAAETAKKQEKAQTTISAPEHRNASRESFAAPKIHREAKPNFDAPEIFEPEKPEVTAGVSSSQKPMTDSRFSDLMSDYVKVMNDHEDYRDEEEEKKGDRRTLFRKRKSKKSAQVIIPESENETKYIPDDDFSNALFDDSAFENDSNESYAQPEDNGFVPQAQIFDEQEQSVEEQKLDSSVVTEPIEEEPIYAAKEEAAPTEQEPYYEPQDEKSEPTQEETEQDYVFDFENMIPSAQPQSGMNIVYSQPQEEEPAEEEREEELFSDLFEDDAAEEKPAKKKKNKKSKKELRKEKKEKRILEAQLKAQQKKEREQQAAEQKEAFAAENEPEEQPQEELSFEQPEEEPQVADEPYTEPISENEEAFHALFIGEEAEEEFGKKQRRGKKARKAKKQRKAQPIEEIPQDAAPEQSGEFSQELPESSESFDAFEEAPKSDDVGKKGGKKGLRVVIGIILAICILATAAVSSLSAVFHVNKAVAGPLGLYCFTSSVDYSNVGVYSGDFVVCKPISSDNAQEAVAFVDKESSSFSFGIKNETVEAEDGNTYCIIDGKAVEKSNVVGKVSLTVPKLGKVVDILFSNFASVVVSLFVLCVVFFLLLFFIAKDTNGKKAIIEEMPQEENTQDGDGYSSAADDYADSPSYGDEYDDEQQISELDDDDDIYTGQYIDQTAQNAGDESTPADEYGFAQPETDGDEDDGDPFSDL